MKDATSLLLDEYGRRPGPHWKGWLTCADCSSLGMDSSTGNGVPPKVGECASCGGVWPLRPVERGPAQQVRLVHE